MRSYHLLTEAELSAEQQKLLSLLSDEDLESIVSELGEAEGGRFAYDPLKRSSPQQAKPISPQAKQQPKPQQPKPQQPKPQPKADPVRKAEIKKTVDTLKPKEKSALVKAAKAELKQRETKPKEVKPAQPGTLKKVVKNLALAALAATVIGGMFGGGDNAPSGADSSTTVQQVQQDYLSLPGDKGQYKILDKKSDANNPNITVLLTQRKNADGTTTYSVRGIDVKNNKEYAVVGTNSGDDAEGLVKMRGIYANPKFEKGVDIGYGTIPSMYRDALRDPAEVKADADQREQDKSDATYSKIRSERNLKRFLRDPDSLKDLQQMAVKVTGKDGKEFIIVVGTFNAKNAFGAYTGTTAFMDWGGEIITSSGENADTFAHVWKKYIDKNGDNIPDRPIL